MPSTTLARSFSAHRALAKRALRGVPSFLHTLFLFTKSDLKTIVIPVSAFAVAAAPLSNPHHLPHVVFWVWLHVLHFGMANQSLGADEDAKNKKDRPIPAGRISIAQTHLLRSLSIPVCLGVSALYSEEVLYASVALVVLTVLYNELAAHRHWIVRNLVNALGFVSFEVGATLIAGADPTRLDAIALSSVIASAGIIVTTIHAQDFKDVDGDRLIGRLTIPMAFSSAAPYTILLPVLVWSLGLSVLWGLSGILGVLLTALGAYTGMLFMSGESVREYQVAFYWYNIWLTCAHSLSAYCRMRSQPYWARG
ncbi:UbiA prenyltransferase family-domain-containing protein [Trametes polyzona]|nr:UbiA prenyltransferase family-domain-containing protein [Trametes polyzona]